METALLAMKILLGFGIGYPIISILAFALVLVAARYDCLPAPMDKPMFLEYTSSSVVYSVKMAAVYIFVAILIGFGISVYI